MRALIVHNQRAGFGSDAIFEFERALVRKGDECVLRIMGDEEAETLVTDAEEFDLVVASGGDGTVSSILHALADRSVLTCVFPSGTANLLFANIGNATEPAALARACRMGAAANLDLGEIGWRTEDGGWHTRGFSLMAGTGYDATIMQAALPIKPSLGQAAYFAAALANMDPKLEHYTITVDGQVFERDGISCLVANNAMMQADIQIVPDCRMDDGLLEAIVLEPSDAAERARTIFAGLLDPTGKNVGRPHIESFKGSHIVVECERPIPLEIDGEVMGVSVSHYEARAMPGAARIIVDSGSPYSTGEAQTSRFGGSEQIAYPK